MNNSHTMNNSNSDETETILSDDQTVLQTRNKPLGVGSRLKERFILEEEIGRGGMGVVYKAIDLRKQETHDSEPYVAIKLITAQVKALENSLIALQREAKKSQQLAHPNIATVYDFDRDGDDAYLCMELLEGEPLSDVLKRYPNGMPFDTAIKIIEGMASALDYAHSQNIVHSDFKPGNVFVTDSGKVKILDFGIARVFTPENQEKEHTVFNPADWNAITPAYASPEMFLGQDSDPRDDIYALGCVSYQVLKGIHPYDKTTALKAREAKLSAPNIKTLSPSINKSLQAAVALERNTRVKSVQEFLVGFAPQRKSKTKPLLLGAAVVSLLAVGAIVFSLNSGQPAAVDKNTIWTSQPQNVSLEKQAKIDRLLEISQAHISVGRYFSPKGSNAAEVYVAILKLQPGNTQAVEGAQAIVNAVITKANRLIDQGKKDEAKSLVNEALLALSGHPALTSYAEQFSN